jgi:hypothetical protein
MLMLSWMKKKQAVSCFCFSKHRKRGDIHGQNYFCVMMVEKEKNNKPGILKLSKQ